VAAAVVEVELVEAAAAVLVVAALLVVAAATVAAVVVLEVVQFKKSLEFPGTTVRPFKAVDALLETKISPVAPIIWSRARKKTSPRVGLLLFT